MTQLDALIATGDRISRSYKLDGTTYASKIPEADIRAFLVAGAAAVDRLAARHGEYRRHLPAPLDKSHWASGDASVSSATLAVLKALRQAVDEGLLTTLTEQVRANVYDDFLLQATELLRANYHVASMVLIGGVLEDRLRKLCAVRALTWTGAGSLSKYNDLLRDVEYDQPKWRRLQSIGDLRNQAAHGHGASVAHDDVEDALKFVGRFLADHPT